MPSGSVTPAGGGNTTAQVVASGKVVPVADAASVTVDSTTYADPIAGGGAKLTTLVFPGDQGALAIALLADAFPRWLLASQANDGLYMGDGTYSPYASGPSIGVTGGHSLALAAGAGGSVVVASSLGVAAATTPTQAPQVTQMSPLFTITNGFVPTLQLVSGTASQIYTGRDAETHTPVTFNPGAATTATCTVAISADNVSFSTLAVWTEPAGVAFDGTIHDVAVRVPAGWYLKLTVNAQAVLGVTSYY